MKHKILITALTATIALIAGAANATDDYRYSNQLNLSKRPYSKPVDPQANKKDNFEGATLIQKEAEAEIEKKHQPMRLHMLGKRPYSEKNTD
jgi:hypothetical protein